MLPARGHTDGFTIIEILVALLLIGVLVLVVLAPLTGLFGLTRQSMRQTDATALAQGVMEDIRGQWQNWDKYDAACVAGGALPSGVTVSVQNMTVQGATSGTATTLTRSSATACPGKTGPRLTYAPSGSPLLRRVTVTATVQDRTSSLIAEVAQP
ncbi:prepilin-type N-terminal cleavage/methylation domain-containing protein [Deinococcus aetherius]|nr:prepilin-type N-terminal cleavage/methylation domain-containing protein [Deinococcus aetherius]